LPATPHGALTYGPGAHKLAGMEKHRPKVRRHPWLCITGVTVLVWSLTAGCGKKEPPVDTRLYGYWETVERGARSAGQGLEILPGDSVVRVMGRMADRPYLIEGDQLTVDFRPPGGDTIALDTLNSKTFTFHFDQDTLVRTYRGQTGWYARLDNYMADSQSILGTWKMARTTDAVLEPSIERFSPGGILHVRLFGRAQSGTYVVNADTLSLTFADQPPRHFTYRIAGDTLYLTLSDGEEGAYLRSGEHLWYGSQSP
jgi:hypothetical protein